MTKDEALDLALEALENLFGIPDKFTGEGGGDVAVWRLGGSYRAQQAITAIKQARALDNKAENARELGLDYEPVLKDNSNYRLDPPVAEPVAFLVDGDLYYPEEIDWESLQEQGHTVASLYTTPPAQRQWVGLTDEEVDEAARYCVKSGQSVNAAIRAIEAKLKEKNT